MDRDGKQPKTYVSTFRMDLRPPDRTVGVGKQRENGLETTSRTLMGNKKLGVSSASDARRRVEAPRFKEPLRDSTVCQGSDATFEGVITGSQPLTVSWLHNGGKVPSENTSFKNGVATLTVAQCSSGNSGIYTCTAENTAGKQSSKALLSITATEEIPRTSSEDTFNTETHENHEAPSVSTAAKSQERGKKSKGPPVKFLHPPEQVEIQVGQQARLHCEFRSSCLPVACCWLFNRDKALAGRPRTLVRSTETQSTVEISQAVSEDSGAYTLVVRNRAGSAQHTVSLSVIDRPHPPASQPVVSQLSSRSLVLSWTGPSFDGGAAVLGYIVEVLGEGPDQPGSWDEITHRCRNTSYRVQSGLQPLGRYRFRVRAYNSAGTSEPSRQSESVTMATANVSSEDKKGQNEAYITVTIDTENKCQEHYNVHEKLGFGKFGEVYRLTHKETGQECAGKFYQGRRAKQRTAALKEIELMNKLHHPRIVQCVAGYDSPLETVMVMEYISGGELFEHIVDDGFEHTEPTSARYMQQILEGVQYVHKQNIVHLDLKPENIVCVDEAGTRIKIIDFGLACELEEGKPQMALHGTPEFAAPEVIGFDPVSVKTDMWSIGVICFILLSGESPFQGNNDAETFALVTTAHYEFDQESFEDISEQAKDFISSLLKKTPGKRLSCTEALSHPWMVSFTPLSRRPTKSLNKLKIKRFLARRKWKKTGKAVLALKRMANLSNSPGSPSEEPGWSQEAEQAVRSLDKQLQTEPRFQRALKDATLPKGATARLTCLVNGYPQPEVRWFLNQELVSGSSRATVEQLEDGLCSLVLEDVELSDCGVYVCRASNKLGEAMCSAKLNVQL